MDIENSKYKYKYKSICPDESIRKSESSVRVTFYFILFFCCYCWLNVTE